MNLRCEIQILDGKIKNGKHTLAGYIKKTAETAGTSGTNVLMLPERFHTDKRHLVNSMQRVTHKARKCMTWMECSFCIREPVHSIADTRPRDRSI